MLDPAGVERSAKGLGESRLQLLDADAETLTPVVGDGLSVG